MQQPQPRPLLGDSVSSASSPTARRNNPVAVLTHQQLQQLQQLQAHNPTGQPLTFALQQPSNNSQEQGNGSATGNHIVYLNQLNQLNQLGHQGGLSHSGTGMGLPPATPTFGVGLNMGLPLSLLNTSLTSLTSNAITTSNPLMNLGLSGINHGLTTLSPNLNSLNSGLNAINQSLSSNLTSNSGLPSLGQDLSSLNALNSTNINSGLTGINSSLSGVNLNQGLNSVNSAVSGLSTNLTTTGINTGLNQGLNQTLSSINSSNSNSFPFQTIQSIQSITPHIAHIPSSGVVSHVPNSSVSSIAHISSSGITHIPSSSVFTHVSSGPNLCASNVTHVSKIAHLANPGTMHSAVSQHLPVANDPNISASSNASHVPSFQSQRQFSQSLNSNLSSASNLTTMNQQAPLNAINNLNSVKSMQNIQNQSVSSPGSPFSVPLKSPASNIAPPTPSPSPNRLMLRSPASNSMQSNRNSPSPGPNTNFGLQSQGQLQSPMQSPMSVGQIQSPAPSPYPPAKSPHHLGGGTTLNNRSPAPGGSPGPPVVRPNTPILQQGMQVLQIIHGAPQGYQSAPTQLVTRTHLLGNQQIQIATAKPPKQPPQILPKPPNQQSGCSQQKQQRVATTMTSQVPQQTQPQLVLAGHQQNPTTATMIPTAQGPLLLNQVLPSSGPVIVQQQPGGVQLILRQTPTNAQQQTHTAQLTQQQLVRVVTAQGMHLQGLAPAFFAVPNGFPPPAPPVLRHTPSSPAPPNSGSNPIVIQNAMVQSPQPQLTQVTGPSSGNNAGGSHAVVDQSLLPPPKKKAKKKKKAKRKDEEPPRLDLASIMKISGIGDDDDLFENDLMTESEASSQMQIEQNTAGQTMGQSSPQVSIPNAPSPAPSPLPLPLPLPSGQSSSAQITISSSLNMNTQHTYSTQSSGHSGQTSQLVAQLQMPVQNPISGHLRLAVGEDGRVVLHHTPEPNQPEIDSATAEAVIRQLTQGGGLNSQKISQLLGQGQGSGQNVAAQSQNLSQTQNRQKFAKSPSRMNQNSPTSSRSLTPSASPHHIQNSLSSFGSSQHPSIQSPQGLTNVSKNIQVSNPGTHNLQQNSSGNESQSPKMSTVCPNSKFQIQNQRFLNPDICRAGQQPEPNLPTRKTGPNRVTGACPNAILQHNTTKYVLQNTQGLQKTQTVQRNVAQFVKNAQSLQQMNLQTDAHSHQPTIQTGQSLQAQNTQHIYQENSNIIQQSVSTIGGQQNLGNVFQQNPVNTSGNTRQNVDMSSQQHVISNDPHRMSMNTSSSQHNMTNSMQQTNASSGMQENVNLNQQQKIGISNAQNNSQQKILIANTQQHEVQKGQPTNTNVLNSAATNILNNAPKITPEILNALSNLNPNDQLLIANANGQMQVISQQLLQQFLAGQLNSSQQTQKIVIGGEPDSACSQNLQGVQINTPTSQIIVNSSGGAPTIQNNIQNIVVQAAPSQMPHQIQIQNSGFPSQFIDNLNQQQIRNLANTSGATSNTSGATSNTTTSSIPKKPKVSKKVKVQAVVTCAQNAPLPQVAKSIAVSRPTMTTTTATSTQKTTPPDHTNKNTNFISQSTNPNKLESPQNGQMVQRVQTIQLPAQKQQMLKNIQAQTQTILARKPNTQSEQALLTKLYQEQARILASGKIICSTSHPVTVGTEATVSVNVVSTVVPTNSHGPTHICKSQTSTAQTQTQSNNPPPPMVSAPHNTTNTTTSLNPQNLQNNPNNLYLGSLMQTQSGAQQNIQSQPSQNILQTQCKQHKFYQNQANQIPSLNPAASIGTNNTPEGSVTSTIQHQAQAQTQQPAMQSTTQQSTQCQTDPLEVKPNIHTLSSSVVKQEMPSPVQIQVQIGSPVGQVSASNSPRIAGKVSQRIQSPVSTGANQVQAKQLASPGSNPPPLASPRQAVKRPASSPICRQINRSDLLEQQLKIDQNGAANPDVNTPFTSKSDACKRLIRYHCFNEQVLSSKDLAKADEIFEETAKHLLSKFNSMMNKYTYLLLMESMREVRTSELMMIDRTFVAEEQSILNRLREQDAKANEELKKEEKPVVPKMEPGLGDGEGEDQDVKPPVSSLPANVAVKRELEDDYPTDGVDLDTKPLIKPSSCTSGDYDEWLEIQKELGVYPNPDTSKCKNSGASVSANGNSGLGVTSKSSKVERTRANGEYHIGDAAVVGAPVSLDVRNVSDTLSGSVPGAILERRWSGATDLERDLLEDTDSLDELALTSQVQCPPPSVLLLSNEIDIDNENDNDDITAQVQSAIDSILNLKQGPSSSSSNNLPGAAAAAAVAAAAAAASTSQSQSQSQSQSSDSKDAALDQAVRSILGS